ncbi:MAG: DUF2156 domain-containing protein [Candidatus Obscuribacterales bacterium]|nr:DUF2156 domain-containing protein [Candidatus Obscuribacterales bacterium]
MDQQKERLVDRIRNLLRENPQPKPVQPDELTLTRGELGTTLRRIKRNQEALQTAVAGARERSETSKFRFTKLQDFGKGSLAYSSLQEGLQYFMHDLGYVAYRQLRDSKDSVVVLSDPLCPAAQKKVFLERFLEFKKDPVFLHIDHDTAQLLNEIGFTVNELGVETIIDIQDFDLVGNKKQQLRQARNNARKDGLTIVELESVDNATIRAFKKIGDDWLREKVTSDQEMRFIVRPLIYVDEMDVRKFVAKLGDEIVGFVVFDPMYEKGQVIGYIANHLRTNLKRTYSVVDYIILEALEKFRAEGKRELSLGLSPLAKVDDTGEFKHSKLLEAHFKYAFEKANYLYNFKNLAHHKLKYRPGMKGAREEKVYCAMRVRFFLVRMNSVYTVLGLKPLPLAIATHVKSQVAGWIDTKFKRCLDSGHCEAHEHDTASGAARAKDDLSGQSGKTKASGGKSDKLESCQPDHSHEHKKS